MAKFVIKRDGSKQPFDAEKIKRSISLATVEAGLEEQRKNEVVEQVFAAAVALTEAKEEIATSEIREKILGDLDQLEPSVSAAWRKYDQEKKTPETQETQEV